MSTGLRISQVAAAAGVHQATLLYYERRGLIEEPTRSPGGHRLYAESTVTALRIIKAAQRLGFTLDEVAGLLPAGRHRHGRAADTSLQAQARAKLGEVDQRIADLQSIRTNLLDALDAECDDLAACAASDYCPLPFAEIATRAAEN